MMMAEHFWAERTQSQHLFATGSSNLNWQQAMAQVAGLSRYLSCRSVKCASLYFDDAGYFAIALLACVKAGIDVCLLTYLSHENCCWLNKSSDILLTDVMPDKLTIPTFLQSEWSTNAPAESSRFVVHNINILLQTSGSSGIAKIIKKTWEELWLEAQTIASVLPASVLRLKPVVLGSVSVQHMYGLSFRIMLSLYLGLPIYRQRLVFPEGLLVSSASFQRVIWVSSPTLLHTLRLSHDIKLVKGHVATIISAGGALAEKSKYFLQQHICSDVVEIYGSTETGVIAYRKEQARWQFFQDVMHKSTVNGLIIQSPRCLPEQILADKIAEYEDGFELLGRLDRIIKLADKRISLLQLENQLMQHEWISDVHILKHPHGSHLAAWVALNHSGIHAWRQYGRKHIINQLSECLAKNHERISIPRYWRFNTVLPRNSQSKLNPVDAERVWAEPVIKPIVLHQQEITADEYLFHLQIPLDLLYFRGHFDNFHLVPGVIQLKWFIELLQQCGWLKQHPLQIENLKFQNFLRPADTVELHLKRDCVRQKITFQCIMNEKKISSGRMVIPAGTSETI